MIFNILNHINQRSSASLFSGWLPPCLNQSSNRRNNEDPLTYLAFRLQILAVTYLLGGFPAPVAENAPFHA